MDYLAINRTAWDARTRVHLDSTFYDVPGFLAGKSSLKEIELAELEVAGKRLLHLQCHFGLDSLSWARLGAEVTGVDLSPLAIAEAQKLARQTGLQAEFICADVLAIPDGLPRFDIVYTSYGAIVWLPDLQRWAETIAACLTPGGEFYMAEFHPAQAMLDGYSYFHHSEPEVELGGTYTENAADDSQMMITWPHSLADVVTALLQAGLRLAFLHEFPYSPYDCFEGLVEAEPGRFCLQHQGHRVPLVFSLKAVKP
jgi:SAM-dependent methyltransferase